MDNNANKANKPIPNIMSGMIAGAKAKALRKDDFVY